MSYILDGYTLPRPKAFTRKQIETGVTLKMLNGTTKKDIVGRKEQYVISYSTLSQSVVNLILAKWNLYTPLTFEVNEANLTIAPTSVLMDIEQREYNTAGADYLEDFSIILTEVS